jgi:ADP-ribosylglycohydrolase
MDKHSPTYISKILRKRLGTLGYSSLKKFAEDRNDFRYSYELLRQVVYGCRVPRAETLLNILQAFRFPPSQIHKVMEFHFGGYPERRTPAPDKTPVSHGSGEKAEGAQTELQAAPAAGAQTGLLADSPEEIASGLRQSLPKIPLDGNEDFWEMARALATLAERKIDRLARREADQPLLFEKEPEAIYQFLVRRGKVPSYMSRGETLPLGFVEGIDYRDRCRGALLGAAIGEVLGRATQGLSPRDIRELFGRIDRESMPAARGGPGHDHAPPASVLLSRSLLAGRKLDPEGIASAYAKSRRLPGSDHHAEFARNLVDRGFPWFEAGASVPETAPAARTAPLALLHAANFRRLKLAAGIEGAVSLDVLGFARGLSLVVSGMEADRSSRGKGGRPVPTLWRKLGTELTALLLRRAEMEDVQETLGNGVLVSEGVPFAWACFLRYADDFAAAVLAAVNLGNEADANGAMVGSLAGGYVGAGGIPGAFLDGLPWREELEASADGLLALARRDS